MSKLRLRIRSGYFSFAVAYTTDQLRFDWKSVAEPVEYDKTLKLSQFEKHDTYIRGLNFSRNETSTLRQSNELIIYTVRRPVIR